MVSMFDEPELSNNFVTIQTTVAGITLINNLFILRFSPKYL